MLGLRYGLELRRGVRTEPVAECVDLIEAALPDWILSIAGCDDDCLGSLPTERVVKDRGHENIGITSQLWGRTVRRHDGLFADSLEQAVVRAVARMVRWRET